MPINIPDELPAKSILEKETVFVMPHDRAAHQDIRPLRIAILNLMPTKIATETQLLRVLGNSPIQIETELFQTASHPSKNTSAEHLLKFYRTFGEVKNEKFDGLIITGAPVEHLAFEEVDYWKELCEIMEWSKSHVFSTFHICWGAQAGLYYHYGIPKYPLPKKMFGIFEHLPTLPTHPLMRGFDDVFLAPHSRHTEVRKDDIIEHPLLDLIAESKEAGVYLAAAKDCRQIFVTGHSEYDRDTLAKEYFRDADKGLPIEIPKNYFPDDDPSLPPPMRWRGHSNLLYTNWVNFVYQNTPYNLNELQPKSSSDGQ